MWLIASMTRLPHMLYLMEGIQRKGSVLVYPFAVRTLLLTLWEKHSHDRGVIPDLWTRRSRNAVRTTDVCNTDETVRPGAPNPRACTTRILVLTRHLRFYTIV
jgi:hypothetical protein